MKTRITILLIFLSLNSYGQIKTKRDWPISIQKEFNSIINEKKIDTVLVYYANYTFAYDPTNPCSNVSSIWVLWEKNKKFYYQQLICDSTVKKDAKEFSGKAFEYFQKHKNAYKLRLEYFKTAKTVTIQTDGIDESLIYMTKHDNVPFYISDWQRTMKEWNKLNWAKVEIKAIDIVKKELKIE